MVEKVDTAVQADEVEILFFDAYTTSGEHEFSDHTYFICGSTEHKKKICPFKINGSKRAMRSGETLAK